MLKLAALFLFLLPVSLLGQLDRIRTDMNEQEFIKSLPEAKRDLDREAVWVGGGDTVQVIAGNSLWRIYNDTVSVYRFNSAKAFGPSYNYPKADSTAVHNMKLSADAIRVELEKQFGKPTTFLNNDLTKIGEKPEPRAYFAIWTFGDNTYIKLSVSTDLSSGNYINAPGKFTVIEAQSYEMWFEVTCRTSYSLENYDVGSSDETFIRNHPEYAGQLTTNGDHIYVIRDTLTSANAHWEFTFSSGDLQSFYYSASTGTGYDSKTDATAYEILKAKSETLLKEGNAAYGQPDSVNNNITVNHKSHGSNLIYQAMHLYCEWTTSTGLVKMNFIELGGGKIPDNIFTLRVDFKRKLN